MSVKYFLVCFMAMNSVVLAQSLPKGNETGNRDLPVATAAIIKKVNEGKTYVIDKEVEGCPTYVKLKKRDEQSTDKKLSFRMDGYKKSDGTFSLERDHFWAEHSYFDYDIVKKEGKLKYKGHGCEFILGIACSNHYQITNKDSVVFEGGAKVLSLAMVASNNYTIKFDTENDKISYFMRANGVEDDLCTYTAAPEIDKEIKAYEDGYKLMLEKMAENVKNEKRESGKRLAPETKSNEANGRATSSK